MNTNPIAGFLRALLLFLTGRVRFIKEDVGREFAGDGGERFRVFRSAVIISRGVPPPAARFVIRFQPNDMGIEANKRFSLLPMMIFMGFTGFRSKMWMVDESTGVCQGLYEWQTMADAENYSRSIAVRFMTRRSVPGSVGFKISQL
jgi:hypothetical protein